MKSLITLLIFTIFSTGLLADTEGIGMLGCYGQQLLKAPHINRLATEGMQFANYHGGFFCAPARWTLMTGMHDGCQGGWGQNRSGLLIEMGKAHVPEEEYMTRFAEQVRKTATPIPEHEVFLAQVAQQAGYRTAQFGKLDVGFLTNHERVKRFGWDFYEDYFSHSRCHGFYPPYLWRNGEKFELEGNLRAHCAKMTAKGNEPVGSDGKTCSQNVFIEGILSFIRTHKDEPFFLYRPTQLPYGPVAIPKLHPDFANHPTLSLVEKKYGSMVKMFNDHVGLIMKELTAQGIDEKTMVVFDGTGGRAGLKRSGYQGGIQCPLIVCLPGKIKPGSRSDILSSHYDFVVTIAEVVGTETPPGKDSISYLPSLLKKLNQNRTTTSWSIIETRAWAVLS